MVKLSTGSIQSIMEGIQVVDPIFKVLNFKSLEANTGLPRYRMSLSDGLNSHTFVMLATQLNEKIETKEIVVNSVIKLDNYILKVQGEKKIIVLLGLTVMDAKEDNANQSTSERIVTRNPPPNLQNISRIPHDRLKSIPINLINSYQNKWLIEGRVSQKSILKTYTNTKGEGKLFNFVLCDSTCDVKIVAFNNEADKFFQLIQIGKTYSLSKANIKMANAKFNNTKCDFEITLNAESEIYEIEDSEELPKIKLELVTIDKIADREVESFVDVVGIAHSVMNMSSITSKTANKEIMKRDVVLVDKSGCSIKLTLWADNAKLLENLEHPVLVIKGAVVKEFNGRSLSCSGNSTMLVNTCDIPEAATLVGWYEEMGSKITFRATNSTTSGLQTDLQVVPISQLVCESDGDKAGYFSVDAAISQIKRENIVYKACATEKCNKKLLDQNDGLYFCEKCQIKSTDFKYRLLLNLNIIDHTSSQWVTAFQEVSELVLGKSALEIGNMVDMQQKDNLDAIFKDALFKKFQLKLRVKNETFNDEARMKVTVIDAKELDIQSTISRLIKQVDITDII